MEEQIEARIDNLTRQLKEETNDSEYARLWDLRVDLKNQLAKLEIDTTTPITNEDNLK